MRLLEHFDNFHIIYILTFLVIIVYPMIYSLSSLLRGVRLPGYKVIYLIKCQVFNSRYDVTQAQV